MTKNEILNALDSRDLETLATYNHEAVKVVRAYCLDHGYNVADLVDEEAERIGYVSHDLTADRLTAYMDARRIGSHFRLSRVLRVAVFTLVVARDRYRAQVESDERVETEWARIIRR